MDVTGLVLDEAEGLLEPVTFESCGIVVESGSAPTVTLNPAKIVTGVGTQATLTASVNPAGNYNYGWTITAPNQGDNNGIVTLNNCANQVSCTLTAGQTGGKATLTVNVTDNSNNQIGSQSARVIVVQITSAQAVVHSNVLDDMTQAFPTSLPSGGIQWPDTQQGSSDWTGVTPLLVLVGNSLPDITLQVNTTPSIMDPELPANAVAFDVRRANDDAANICPNGCGTADIPTFQDPGVLQPHTSS